MKNYLACKELGDNCMQSVGLVKYIVRHTVGNLVRQRVSGMNLLNKVIPILMHSCACSAT